MREDFVVLGESGSHKTELRIMKIMVDSACATRREDEMKL
jgi:hypothetical protein